MKINNEKIQRVSGDLKKRNNLSLITLKDFIHFFQSEIREYYGLGEWGNLIDEDCGVTILCLSDFNAQKMKRRLNRRAGKNRREKYNHRHTYKNPFNRIHGFIILEDCSDSNVGDRNVVSVSAVGSSFFSTFKGIGTSLLHYGEMLMKNEGYTDMVLEVSNDYAENATRDDLSEEEFESSEEESSEEEYSEEESSEEEDFEPSEEEELESLTDIIAHELWRKIMRIIDDIPYYSLNEDYLYEYIQMYFENTEKEKETDMKKQIKVISDEPDENEYGGFWYKKGRHNCKDLIGFYEYMGFHEDPNVHTNWGCFSEIPYPSMRKTL